MIYRFKFSTMQRVHMQRVNPPVEKLRTLHSLLHFHDQTVQQMHARQIAGMRFVSLSANVRKHTDKQGHLEEGSVYPYHATKTMLIREVVNSGDIQQLTTSTTCTVSIPHSHWKYDDMYNSSLPYKNKKTPHPPDRDLICVCVFSTPPLGFHNTQKQLFTILARTIRSHGSRINLNGRKRERKKKI